MAVEASSQAFHNIRQSLHSLAQPLAVLTGLVDLLLLELDQSNPALPEVRQISEQLEKVLQIVGGMHQMAREAMIPAESVPRGIWAQPKP